MMADTQQKTLLDQVREQSCVDCDTLDVEVAKSLGPFVDCTSNQAIAFAEISKPQNEHLVKESVQLAKELHSQYAEDVSLEELATDIIMVKLSARMTPYITGIAHVQTNPKTAFSIPDTIKNAERLISLYRTILPSFPSERVCIKIPSTWEGLNACRVLEKKGIHTLGTILFSMEQVALAAEVGCSYIAPYVNELKVHFVPGHIDTDKGINLTHTAQTYLSHNKSPTKTMPASLTSIPEILSLLGSNHITISPPLLAILSSTPSDPNISQSSELEKQGVDEKEVRKDYSGIVNDEGLWREGFKRSRGGSSERKLGEALEIFGGMQGGIEGLVGKVLG